MGVAFCFRGKLFCSSDGHGKDMCEAAKVRVGSGHGHASVGTISAIDAIGKLKIYTPASSKAWMTHQR